MLVLGLFLRGSLLIPLVWPMQMNSSFKGSWVDHSTCQDCHLNEFRGTQHTEVFESDQWESAPSFSGIITARWCAGTRISILLYDFWIFAACCAWPPWIGVILRFSFRVFPAFLQSKFCSKSSTWNFDERKKNRLLWLPCKLYAWKWIPGNFSNITFGCRPLRT